MVYAPVSKSGGPCGLVGSTPTARTIYNAIVAESRYTRKVEGLVGLGSWGFESPRSHHLLGDHMGRREAWERLGRPDIYGLWIRDRVTEFAIANGYEADLSFSRNVVIRTQAEANNAAMVTEGHDAFDAFCDSYANNRCRTPTR